MFLNRIVPISAALVSSVALVSSARAQTPSVTITSVAQAPTASNPTSRDISVSANAFAGSVGFIGFVLVRNDTNTTVYSEGFGSNPNISTYSKVIPNVPGGQYTLNVYANTGLPNYNQVGQSMQISVPVSNGSPIVSIATPTQVVTPGNPTSKNVTVNATAFPGAAGIPLQYIGFHLTRKDGNSSDDYFERRLRCQLQRGLQPYLQQSVGRNLHPCRLRQQRKWAAKRPG
jgi:hypothetical protein